MLIEHGETAVELTAQGDVQAGEVTYSGVLSTGEDVEVEVLSALPVPEAEDELTEAPLETVDTEEEVVSESATVEPEPVDASQLEPVIAYATTPDTIAVTVPEDVMIESASIDDP